MADGVGVYTTIRFGVLTLIYPIKIYNKENKLVKEFDSNQALKLFIGDTYVISEQDRKDFWDRVWIEKTGPDEPESCGPLKYKKRKLDQIVKCKFCNTEIVTASKRRKWCSPLCKTRFKNKEDPKEVKEVKEPVPELPKENSFVVKCTNCRKEIRTTSQNRKWCTEKCRKSFKRLDYKESEIEWEIVRGAPYAYHVYLNYKPKNMIIHQASEHNMIQAKEFCIRELKWRLKNWDEYQKSRVREED